tara:strand:+ start:7013 stop:7423 length:411 start_codon:yes stop_codon:yes gene_type:complete
MIGKAIYNILTTDATVSAKIGLRCYPNINTERANSFPYIVYTHAGEDPHDTKNGVSTLNTALIDVSIYTNDMLVNEILAEEVRQALDRKSGTYNTIVVQSVQYTNQSNQFEFDGTDDDDGLFLISQTYKIRYEPVN